MIYLKHFDPHLLKIDKKPYKDINIYYIGCNDCENTHSVNPLYLLLGQIDAYVDT